MGNSPGFAAVQRSMPDRNERRRSPPQTILLKI
jgi:hypothetical protein